MKANYHTHTYRCHHASGSDEEYVLAAIENGYEILGFSDHGCWNYERKDFVSRIRMDKEQFDDYYRSIAFLKEKYKDKIEIKIGMEFEYFPKYMGWLKAFLQEKPLDYILFGNHYYQSDEYGLYYGMICHDDAWLSRYVDDCIAGLSTGLYSYLAHPDLFMRSRPCFDEMAYVESVRLCTWCKEHDILLEYNLEGARIQDAYKRDGSYPCRAFWEVASSVGCSAILGVDAHHPDSLRTDQYRNEGLSRLKALGMNVVDQIPYPLKTQEIS